jgi:hypothetical protein
VEPGETGESAVSARPPRPAERLLGFLLPADLRDEALEELADLHAARLATAGRAAADRWYWGQLPRFAVRIRLAVTMGGPLGPSPSRIPLDPPGETTMHSVLTDLRHAARSLRHTPGFTAIAVLTLALGIGATASISSVVRAVLLSPLPFPEPERLVQLSETRADRNMFDISFTYANFWDVHDMNRTFEAIGAIRWSSRNLGGSGEPARLTVASATVGFFRSLGVWPEAGRLFLEGEDRTGSDSRIAVLAHAFWRSRFGGDSAIVGRTVVLDRDSYQVVGVLPPGMPWLDGADLFIPFVRPAELDRDSWELPVIGRIARGVPLAAVRLLRSYNPGDIPRLAEAAVDGWVVVVTLGATLFTSLATGLVPALRTPYDDVVSALREGERNVGHRRGGRVRHVLVAVEVALSLVLLVGA